MTPAPRTSHSAVHPTVARAFHALDETGLPWVLLRGEDDLARPAGDVDILVAAGLLPVLDELMAGTGLCRVRAAGHGSHRFYFGYSDAGELWLKLDVVSEISFGPFQQWRTPLAPGCLQRRVRSGALWLPAPDDQAWLQLLHLALDKGDIQPQREESARAAAAVASTEDRIAEYVDQRSGAGTAAQLLGLVRSGRFDRAPAMSARLRSDWTRGAPLRTPLLALANRALRQLSPRLPGRGLVVGVMAPDGAGKTTLLNGLRAAFPIPTAYVYMGLWGAGPWDGWLHRVPGGRTAKKMFRVLKGGMAARYHRVRGRVVLMDRVAYDALLPGAGDTKPKGGVSNALALWLGAAPDLLLVLDVPGEVMFARKGEHTAEILEKWRQSYLLLADRLPGSRILDAAQPQQLVQRLATKTVWRRMCPGVTDTSGTPDGSGTHDVPGTADGRGTLDGPGAPDVPERDPGDAAALSLHLWRLLDWRFLVPVLQPRSVGYGGAVGPDLLAALHLLDPDAARIHSGGNGGPDGAFEVVLLREPELPLFEEAAAAVQPGGWMCAQVKRSVFRRPGRRQGPRTLAGWKRTFERHGFDDVSVYWHATSLDTPRRLVPVASPTAVLDTLALHKGVPFGRAKAVMARLALVLRLFDVAVPEGTVTGRRPEN
jgi:hypothetical protein